MSTADLLPMLLELQNLDRVPRTGYTLRGVRDPESVSEHSWHLAFLVWTLGGRVDGLDRARAIELALVHDVAEVRIGDWPRSAAHYVPEGAKRTAEAAAAADLLAPLGAEALAAFEEFEAEETLEARFVRVCDRLQLFVKISTYGAQGLGDLEDFWDRSKDFDDGGFAPVAELFNALVERRP